MVATRTGAPCADHAPAFNAPQQRQRGLCVRAAADPDVAPSISMVPALASALLQNGCRYERTPSTAQTRDIGEIQNLQFPQRQ
jgi:hypothetical protein